ncbi:M6 family metalloprotease domain-containing protein [Ruminiclostridium herbifermentans]|uniref:cellulase n=1 Tax=Ruminiclostridium herbifermentans TaxID=2488810 RepID=A0A4U7JK62_9FIRM|nr:M6 family metalloprotease domain-containing protein [Ruminiclostridium herbifermentans]QNU68190.1 M6 family metalloprotease domain-containing protein [Ruminiclostridium herbifermentans]
MKGIVKKALVSTIFTCIISFLGSGVYAAPYVDRIIEFKQPDNSVVEVKVTGDEYYQHVESPDGYTLCRDPETGWICYADLNSDQTELVSSGEIYRGVNNAIQQSAPKEVKSEAIQDSNEGRRQKHLEIKPELIAEKRNKVRNELFPKEDIKNNITQRSSPNLSSASFQAAPLQGNVIGLTILINFPDVSSSISKTDIDNMFNKVGYTGYGNNGSIRDYFYDVSGGKLNYTNTITGFYMAKKPKSYYDSGADYSRALELAYEALSWLDSTGFNFATLTTNSQKYVLAVNFLYAGDIAQNWGKGIWPHQGWLPYVFNADGVKVQMYQMSEIGRDLSIYTICHENGHLVCDYPDLYDYDGDSAGCGNYSLMSGSVNYKNPAPPDPFCRNIISGWNSTVSLNSYPKGSTINAESDPLATHTVYKWSGSNANEYFLIENIKKAGRYSNMPDEGLLIWHIDEKGINDYNQMTASRHYQVSVEQADGLFQLEKNINLGRAGDLFRAGYKTAFDDTTTPNSKWWNGTSSGLKISNIGPVGTTLTFTLDSGTAAVNTAPVVDAGANCAFTLPSSIKLSGKASDDGLPGGSSLTTTWSLESGPGTATFENAKALKTNVTVSVEGTYVFKLTASDGVLSSSDTVTIKVNPAGTLPLIAHYNFDETSGTTVNDSSGLNYTAKLNGGAVWAEGQNGNAVSLDGKNGYVSIPTGILSNVNEVTISTWVKLNSLTQWSRIWDFGIDTNSYMFLTPQSDQNKLKFAISINSYNNEEQINAPEIETGVWKHITVTLSGNTGILYVDGVEVARNDKMTLNPTSIGSTTQNYIGKSQFDHDPYLNGIVDDFKIFNKALNADEVKALFDSKQGIYIYGDVNGDGEVDAIDFAVMKKYLLGDESAMQSKDWQITGDLNKDGTIDAIDIANMKKFLLGIIEELPVN